MLKGKTFSNPEKDYCYRIFAEYFDHMRLEKVRDEDKLSIYMAKLPCMLLNEQRYVIAMVPRDNYPPSHQKMLDELQWVSLQTRNLTTEYPTMIRQTYELKRNGVYEKRVMVRSRSPEITIYDVEDLPLMVSLLHVRRNEYEYPNEGMLNSALETFRTIIQFKE